MTRIAASSGTLKKLGFSVRRIADVEGWGSVAEEELLDRRKAGPFYGRGSLIAAATEALKPAWETGSAAEVQGRDDGLHGEIPEGPAFARALCADAAG